ncbi:MAG: hypothetical protein OD918_01705 [Gammaproteobacteria bacterium]
MNTPRMNNTGMNNPRMNTRWARIKLVILFAAFLGPLLASFVWYYALDASRAPRARANHAPLVSPAIALTHFSNATADGAHFDRAMLLHKWNLLHMLPARCDSNCEKALYHTRQTRLALGRNAPRLRRILLSPSRALLDRLAAAHPDALRILQARHGGGIEKQLAPIVQSHARGGNDALLIDPLGNVMMRIPAGIDPRLLLKDLKKLLRLSRVG